MIYITGDTHNEYENFIKRLSKVSLEKDDIIIVTGDFGFVGSKHLSDLELLPYTICFVDGNHENFAEIYSYPIQNWCGGQVHKISDNIYHLMRGQIFTIEGKTFFTMGGAYSIDKEYRAENIDWWKEELPSAKEYAVAIENLQNAGNKVDYIVTHTVPQSVIFRMGFRYCRQDAKLTDFFEWLKNDLEYKHWYAGHFHVVETYDKISIMYFNVERAE